MGAISSQYLYIEVQDASRQAVRKGVAKGSAELNPGTFERGARDESNITNMIRRRN
jgi:hypothetical protein